MSDPGQLLTQSPSGGSQMISLVRDLVASDPNSLPAILNLDAKANAAQVEAIGIGLGQAALVCGRTEQAFAHEILLMAVTADDQPLSRGFSAVMGDLSFTTTGPAGVGGGGGPSAASGASGHINAGGAPLNLTTSVPMGSTKSPWSSAFTSTTSGSPGNLFTLGTPGSSSGVINAPNTRYRSVSPSRP